MITPRKSISLFGIPLPTVSTRSLAQLGPILGLLAVLSLFIGLLTLRGELGSFLSPQNIQFLLHKSSIPAVVALGMLLIIITGGIDLSVGSVAALATVAAMQTFRALEAQTGSQGLAGLGAVAAGVGTGALAGLVNGVTITQLRVSPFVATLGMMSIARGLAVWLAGRTRISFGGARPAWVDSISRATDHNIIYLDPGVWSVLVLVIVVAVLLRFTIFGRYCYAIGSNEATARLCGVSVAGNKIATYVIAGLLTGWAGVLLFCHTTSGDPNAGSGLELEVIAAVVIGGASLSGGQGNVFGTLLGVLILGVLENGVSLFNVPIEVKYILIGSVIVANTALSEWQRRRSA
jgi:ribose transport system permease protein